MDEERPVLGAPIIFRCECIVCGAAFSYEGKGVGRRRRFCSPVCKQVQHKLKLRQYRAEDRYGVRAARLEIRDRKRGNLLPLDLSQTEKGEGE